MGRKNKYPLTNGFLTTINGIAVIFLLISYLARNQVPSHHPAVAVFGLFFPVLFLANLIFFLFWLMQKDAKFLVSLLVLFMGIPQLKNHLAFHDHQETNGKARWKIISYNVQGFSGNNHNAYRPEIKAKILRFLVQAEPDILCLQEYSGKKKDLLAGHHSGNNAYFHRYYSQKGSKNTGLLTVTKGKIFRHRFFKFKGYRTFGILTDMVMGKDTLRVINLHLASISLNSSDLDLLSSPPSASWEKGNTWHHYGEIYRKLQKAYRLRVKQLTPVIQTVRNSRWPVVLCGDFNDTPSSWAYHRMSILLKDAFVEKGKGISTTYAGPLPFLRIDYLFAGRSLSVTAYRKYTVPYSDHFPVSMEVQIPSP